MDSEDCPTLSLYLPVPQSLQLVMSSSLSTGPYVPTGQASQAVALENGFKFGFAMKVPGEQHPKRPWPVDVKKLFEDKACHWPPHNVRVKPLLWNTLTKIITERV